jgi:hypothetical protein
MHFMLALVLVACAPFSFVSAHEGPDAFAHVTDPASMLMARMHATADTLQNISDRIDTRATIVAQSGADSSAVRPLLEAARGSIGAANVLIDARAEAASIVAHLMRAHTSLMGALEALKSADAGVSNEEILAPEVQ